MTMQRRSTKCQLFERRARLFGSVVACALLILLGASSARAEPYIAQREGFKCSKCHENRSGGGKRTAFGSQYALTHLSAFASSPQKSTSAQPPKGAAPQNDKKLFLGFLDPNLNDYVSIGADVRASNDTIFADEVHNSFANREANPYLRLRAFEQLSFYLDTSFAEGNVEVREAQMMVAVAGFHLKAGYLLLPYGLRIWNDDEFIRKNTGHTFASPDIGLELGFERGFYGVFIAASNGSGGGLDPDNDKKLSLLMEATFSSWRAGVSASLNRTEAQTDNMFGAHTGVTLGRFCFLAEADVVRANYGGNREAVYSLLLYAQANLLVLRGLNLKVAYGYHDPALDVPEDQRMHLRSGIELFPMPALATGVFYDFRASVPQDEIGGADVLTAEAHLYF